MTSIERVARRPGRLGSLAAGLALGSLLVWTAVADAAPAPESFSGLAKRVSPAVVNISSVHHVSGGDVGMFQFPFQFPEGSPFERFFKDFRDRMGRNHGGATMTALGSGFIIDSSGYVVTNNHVVKDANSVTVKLGDDSEFPAKVLGTDPQTDLALLKIDAGHPLPAVHFGDSDKAEVGDWVMAVGNPFGLGGTVTAGIISARGRNINSGPYDDFLQVDASINQGNSGGPLFNTDGSVIGVNTAIFSPNGGSVGIGFAIPSNIVKTVVAQLRTSGKVERGWLGVRIQKVTPEIANAVGLDDAQGALITQVTPDSPAKTGGLKQGDIILRFDGNAVDGPRDLARIVARTSAGKTADIEVWRGDRRTMVSVVTGHQPSMEQMASNEPQSGHSGGYHSEALNAELAALSSEQRSALGMPDEVRGVVVLNLELGKAYDQGLREGDVIEQVDRHPVTEPNQVDRLIEQSKSRAEKAVLLLVNRQGQDLYLGLKLGLA